MITCQVDSDKLVEERNTLRRECRLLRRENDELEQDPKRVHEVLAAMGTRLESCAAAVAFAARPAQAQQEVMREIRSGAAVLALQCMAIMQLCACAVHPFSLLRVHVAGLRPREAGTKNMATNAMVPAIGRMYAKSLPLRIAVPLLWVLGVTCHYSVLFDGLEPGSVPQWLACTAGTFMLPVVVCAGGSLNVKTVRALLKSFETMYVIAYVLLTSGLYCLLFREQPAKIVTVALATPALLLAGFQDACAEGSRLLNSRIFFACNNVGLILWLALVTFNLGAFTDYTFQFGTFAVVASTIFYNAIATVLLFGVKNIVFSCFEPGSLVVLTSAVCCVFLDADSLAVLKGSYLLIGQSFGKFARNKTIDKYLKRQCNSIAELTSGRMGAMQAVAPAPTPAREPEAEPPNAVTVVHSAGAHLLVEVEVLEVGLDITLGGGEASGWSDAFPCAGVSGASSAATGGNCPPWFSQYIHEH